MTTMRAKMRVSGVTEYKNDAQDTTQETLRFHAVCKADGYPADGHDDDNTYARWSPYGELTLGVANPALFGQFAVGDKFYLDFTRA